MSRSSRWTRVFVRLYSSRSEYSLWSRSTFSAYSNLVSSRWSGSRSDVSRSWSRRSTNQHLCFTTSKNSSHHNREYSHIYSSCFSHELCGGTLLMYPSWWETMENSIPTRMLHSRWSWSLAFLFLSSRSIIRVPSSARENTSITRQESVSSVDSSGQSSLVHRAVDSRSHHTSDSCHSWASCHTMDSRSSSSVLSDSSMPSMTSWRI